MYTNNLEVGYASRRHKETIFSHLNLVAKVGQLHCLLGINGIGKSTLLRTLAGLQAPLAGSILVDEISIEQYNNSSLAQKIAVVLTNQGINANLTVSELVEMGRYPHTNWMGKIESLDREKVNQSIDLCEIGSIANKSIHKISDGQLQKTLIARALAQDCSLILLDEPTNHLDPNNRYLIIELLRKIAHEAQKCIIMSTHQVEMAMQLADIIWLAKADHTIQSNTPERLTTNGMLHEIFPFIKLG